jgi:hypothetical protein
MGCDDQAFTGLTAKYDSTTQSILLEWKYTSEKSSAADKQWFIIYRASDDDTFEQHEAVNMPKLTFQERVNPTFKRIYRYAIAVTHGRSTSPLSEEVTVSIP